MTSTFQYKGHYLRISPGDTIELNNPSMQIHPTRIDIFVIHKILQRRGQSSSSWLIESYNSVTFVETVSRNQASSPPDYSYPADNKSMVGSCHFVSLGPRLLRLTR